jgi:hypothetical protein
MVPIRQGRTNGVKHEDQKKDLRGIVLALPENEEKEQGKNS